MIVTGPHCLSSSPGKGVIVGVGPTAHPGGHCTQPFPQSPHVPIPHNNLVACTGKECWVYGGPSKLQSRERQYTHAEFKVLSDLLIVHLRHQPLSAMDTKASCDIPAFFDRFRIEYPEELSLIHI